MNSREREIKREKELAEMLEKIRAIYAALFKQVKDDDEQQDS